MASLARSSARDNLAHAGGSREDVGQMTGFPGASWWKLDVHTHTPASTDFGKGSSDHPQLRKISPMDWLLAFMRAGIDAVVVTDHNCGAWIERAMIPDSLGDRRNGPGHRRGTRGQCRLVRRGSLQSRDVRDRVCAMMEGGREALEKRYRRIIGGDDHV